MAFGASLVHPSSEFAALLIYLLGDSGGFLFGYDIGVISGCLIMPDFVQRFGVADASEATGYLLSASRQAQITSLLSAGTFFGSLGFVFLFQ